MTLFKGALSFKANSGAIGNSLTVNNYFLHLPTYIYEMTGTCFTRDPMYKSVFSFVKAAYYINNTSIT